MDKKGISFSLGFASIALAALIFSANLNAQQNDDPHKNETKMQSLARLTKVIGMVENSYVDDLNLSQVVDKSIAGLLSQLDAHSNFMNEKDFKDLQEQTSGEFGGLGIQIGMKDSALTVIAPIEGTPADKKGIKANDVILRIDGNSTIGMSLDEAVSKMRGKPKTDVTITIVRKGENKPFDVKITRDIIKSQSVYAKTIESENILYLRVTNFDAKVTADAKRIINENKDAKGIILDLRNNPGGLLDQAIGLVNLFVNSGVIVSQRGQKKEENIEYKADSAKKITNLPLVVLVNGGSASASEIVSGALQDLKRGIIVGEKTFGKGSVQAILPVSEKEALRLTIARYYLPSGRSIQAVGVTPDILVSAGKVATDDETTFSLKEADLKQHLQSELDKIDTKTDKDKKEKQDDKKIITKKQILDDIQLKTAIDGVKILNLTSNKGDEK